MKVVMMANLWLLSVDGKRKIKVNRNDILKVEKHKEMTGVYIYEFEGKEYLISEFFLLEE